MFVPWVDQADRGRMLHRRAWLGVHERRDVDDLASGRVGQDRRRLGEHRQVRRLPALDARLQHGLVARADAVDLDLDAGRRRKVGDRGSEVGAFSADPLCLDRNGLAAERLVCAKCLVQLGVAGRDCRHGRRRRGRRRCARRQTRSARPTCSAEPKPLRSGRQIRLVSAWCCSRMRRPAS